MAEPQGRNRQAAASEIERRAKLGDSAASKAWNYLKQFGDDVLTLGNTINAAVMNPLRTGEVINTMASGMVAEPVAGLSGLVAAGVLSPHYGGDVGMEAGAKTVERVRDAMTYRPRGMGAQEVLGQIPETRVGRAVQGFADMGEGFGGKVLESTGSPAAAAMTSALFQASPDIVGARFVPKGRADLTMGDIGTRNRQAGIFAGVKAKTADQAQFAAAEELAKRGMGRDEIFKQTGLHQGADKQWRLEIDDSGAKIKGRDFTEEITAAVQANDMDLLKKLSEESRAYKPPHEEALYLSEALQHKDLFEAYPDTAKTLYSRDEGMNLGSASYNPKMDIITTGNLNRGALKSPLLHETQHAIQEREGFARGGSPAQFEGEKSLFDLEKSQMDELAKESGFDDWEFNLMSENPAKFDEIMSRWDTTDPVGPLYKEFAKTLSGIDKTYFPARMAQYQKSLDSRKKTINRSPIENYKRLAGEAEARLTQERMNMSAAERTAYPPYKHMEDMLKKEGIDPADLIVKKGMFDRSSDGASINPKQQAAIKELKRRGKY